MADPAAWMIVRHNLTKCDTPDFKGLVAIAFTTGSSQIEASEYMLADGNICKKMRCIGICTPRHSHTQPQTAPRACPVALDLTSVQLVSVGLYIVRCLRGSGANKSVAGHWLSLNLANLILSSNDRLNALKQIRKWL